MEKEQFNNLSQRQKEIYCFIENCVYDASREMSKTQAVDAIFSRFIELDIPSEDIPELKSSNNPFENWCSLSEFQEMFNYGSTQMAALLKDTTLKVAKVGKRKYILKESIAAFLEKKSKS